MARSLCLFLLHSLPILASPANSGLAIDYSSAIVLNVSNILDQAGPVSGLTLADLVNNIIGFQSPSEAVADQGTVGIGKRHAILRLGDLYNTPFGTQIQLS